MDKINKIVLTGGGSGGHVIPLIALLPQLKEKFAGIFYVGTSGVEKKLATDAGLPFFVIRTSGLNRSKPLKNILMPFSVLKSVVDCVSYFRKIKPDLVFSKGGYVGLPPMIAARLLRLPSVCHESDLSIGLANKIAYKLGSTVLTGFYQTSTLSSKFIYSGFPLRESLFLGNKDIISKKYSLNLAKPTLLIVGGSLGSVALNTVIADALPRLISIFNVIHLTGKNKSEVSTRDGYYPVEYADDIQNYYAAADVIVSRCGAGSLVEIAALEKSAVFIPLPKTASRGDQLDNAKLAAEYGATVLLQENLSADTLLSAAQTALTNKMRPISAAENVKIANILFSIAETHKRP